ENAASGNSCSFSSNNPVGSHRENSSRSNEQTRYGVSLNDVQQGVTEIAEHVILTQPLRTILQTERRHDRQDAHRVAPGSGGRASTVSRCCRQSDRQPGWKQERPPVRSGSRVPEHAAVVGSTVGAITRGEPQ